jgi:hypothetical protein
MILGKTTHPTEVKRIRLNLWKLRDEIESTLAYHLKKNPNDPQAVVEKIRHYYSDDQYITKMIKKTADIQTAKDKLKEKQDNQPTAELTELNALIDGDEESAEETAEAQPETIDTEESDESMDAMAAAMEGGGEEDDDSMDAMAAAMEGGGEEDDESMDAMAAAMETSESSDNVVDFPAPVQDADQEHREITRCRPDQDVISIGYTLLADIYMDEILFYSRHEFFPGQAMVIEFLIPKKFTINAEITYVRNIALHSRIISETKPHYRMKAKFICNRPGMRTILRDFIKSIAPDIKSTKKASKKQKKDELDELDF